MRRKSCETEMEGRVDMRGYYVAGCLTPRTVLLQGGRREMYLPAPASHGYKLAQCISTPLDFQAEHVGSPSSPQLAMGNS